MFARACPRDPSGGCAAALAQPAQPTARTATTMSVLRIRRRSRTRHRATTPLGVKSLPSARRQADHAAAGDRGHAVGRREDEAGADLVLEPQREAGTGVLVELGVPHRPPAEALA